MDKMTFYINIYDGNKVGSKADSLIEAIAIRSKKTALYVLKITTSPVGDIVERVHEYKQSAITKT